MPAIAWVGIVIGGLFMFFLVVGLILSATGYQTTADKTATAKTNQVQAAVSITATPKSPTPIGQRSRSIADTPIPSVTTRLVATPIATSQAAAQIVPTSAATPISPTLIRATSTSPPPPISTTIPPTVTPVAPMAAVASPLDQDKAAITAVVVKVLSEYLLKTDITDKTMVDYSVVGWKQKEPLIREIQLDASGVLSIYFSAWPSGDSYIDVSDYNSAEIDTVEIAADVKALKLNMPLIDIAVAAWAPLPILGNCKMQRIDRMAFVRLKQPQFPLVTFDQWGDLNGDEMFTELKKRGISTEIYAAYKVCI